MSAGANYASRNVAGRVALITGGSRGLGLATAQELYGRGARVFIVARDGAALATAASSMPAKQGADTQTQTLFAATPLVCDVSRPEQIRGLFVQLETILGDGVGLDILVLAAGVMPGLGTPPLGVSDEADVDCMMINATGSVLCAKHATTLLLKPQQQEQPHFDRTVVFLTSCEGWLSTPTEGNGMLSYRASKAAVNGCMVAMSQLYSGEEDITALMVRGGLELRIPRIVSVHPGYVQTGLGIEDARIIEPDLTHEELAARKAEDGCISVAQGCDSIVWAICAAEGVESGKAYFERKVHPF